LHSLHRQLQLLVTPRQVLYHFSYLAVIGKLHIGNQHFQRFIGTKCSIVNFKHDIRFQKISGEALIFKSSKFRRNALHLWHALLRQVFAQLRQWLLRPSFSAISPRQPDKRICWDWTRSVS